MNANRTTGTEGDRFRKEVAQKAGRRMKARREKDRGVWFGLGMFGLVGWTVALPTVTALAIGLWIDARWPSRFSWTLMSLFVGMVLGCIGAWHWVRRESRDE